MPIQYTARHRVIAVIAALTMTGAMLTACADNGSGAAAAASASVHVDNAAGQSTTAALPAISAVQALDHSIEDPSTGAEPAVEMLDQHNADHSMKRLSARIALYSAMRTVWDQHMQWTYDTVLAFAADSPGLQPTVDRILRNQVDIGNAIAPYYGDAAASKLTDLLSTHIKDAIPVLTTAKAGDTAALNTAVTAWYANAQDIADFLAEANPNWAKRDMRKMMKAHITQTIGYASDVLAGNWSKAIADYDQAQAHMDQMADMLSAGIITQFPAKF